MRKQRQESFGGLRGTAGDSGRHGEPGRDNAYLDMLQKMKPTRVENFPAIYKKQMVQNILPGHERFNKAEAALQKKRTRFGTGDQ